jgi:hypothetical protein
MDAQKPDRVFTAADRIRQLNEIDKVSFSSPGEPLDNKISLTSSNFTQDVTLLLRSAGQAIRALTNSPLQKASPSEGSLEAHQRTFKDAAAQYFTLLSSIDVRLRRQVYALEEADIIQPDTTEGAGGPSVAVAAAGGVNPLEISWLNSRKDTVGKDKEAELWADASRLVTQLREVKAEDGLDADVHHRPAGGDNMEVD